MKFDNYTLLILALLIVPLLATAQKNREFNLDQSYDIGSDATINMRTDDAEVRITGSDTRQVKVRIERRVKSGGLRLGDEHDLTVKVYTKNGDLHISDRQPQGVTWNIMGYSYEVYRIDIETPAEVNLKLEGDDDNYLIRNVNGNIEVRLDDGDLELLDCQGEEFDFRVDDGDINMNSGQGELYADIEDGDLIVDKGSFEQLLVKIDDGNVDVKTDLKSFGTYRITSDDGQVDLTITGGGGNIDVSHDNSRISTTPEFKLLGKTEHNSRYQLPGGDAEVVIRADDGSIRLSAYSTD